jgi:hypothetical protein
MCYCNNFELACLTVHSDNGLLAQEKQGHGVVHKTPECVLLLWTAVTRTGIKLGPTASHL